MAIDLKPNQEKINFISAFYKLTILTESYVHFLIMKYNKEKTVSTLGTGFGTEHVFFSHCVTKRTIATSSLERTKSGFSNQIMTRKPGNLFLPYEWNLNKY